MSKRKSTKFKHNPDKPFANIHELDKHFQDDNAFVCALESSSEFTDQMGVFSIISYDEIINIKFKVNKENSSRKHPLEFDKLFRIKDTYGSKIIRSNGTHYLLTRDRSIHRFKSQKSIERMSEVSQLAEERIYFFKSFGEKYVIIKESNTKIVVAVCDSSLSITHEFDLMCNEDTLKELRKENDVTKVAEDVHFNVEFLQDISEDMKAESFFSTFLNCNLLEENIKNILLVSVNERLLWIKYGEDITDESSNEPSIHTKLITKGKKILALRYHNGGLMIIDEYHMLSVYFCDNYTKLIKKTEIPLVGGVRCFQFYEEFLFYASKYKMIFMKFFSPDMEPETSEINLGLITTFSVVGNHDFLIAVDANNFFYYVPIQYTRQLYDREDRSGFFELSNDDIIRMPESIKYLEEQERELKRMNEEFEREMDLKILFDHLEENDDFVGGNATVNYIGCLPKISSEDIVCNRTNSHSSGGYIQISLTLQDLLLPFSFSLTLHRHSKDRKIIVRDVEIKKRNCDKLQIFIPSELGDNFDNKLELFIHFKTEETVLEFPVEIVAIAKDESYQDPKNELMESCVKEIEMLLKANNI